MEIFLTIWAIEQWRNFGYHDSTIALMVKGVPPSVAAERTGQERFEDWTQRFYERNIK